MKIENTVRMEVLRGEGDKIRKLLLTDQQIKLVEFIRLRGTITAAVLASLESVSIQNASSKLSKLEAKGYLGRGAFSSDSGGVEFVYRALNK